MHEHYINATALCAANDKAWTDYVQAETTQAFLDALVADLHVPLQYLIVPDEDGIWVHLHIAIHLAQWCSPEMAVKVAAFVWDRSQKSGMSLETLFTQYG